MPMLVASRAPGGGRVVVVSSELHRKGYGKMPASPSYLRRSVSPTFDGHIQSRMREGMLEGNGLLGGILEGNGLGGSLGEMA